MQNAKQDTINFEELGIRIFELKNIKIQDQCIRLYKFKTFLIAFLAFTFFYTLFIPKINIIDCKTEGKIEVYIFAPLMFGENSLFSN